MKKGKTEKIKDLKTKIDANLVDYDSFFSASNINLLDLDEKIEEVDCLIEHVNQRINYTESRITRTVTFSVTLIGIGMAFFAVTTKLSGLSFYLGLIAAGLFILTGGITSIIHTFQVNPNYPFRALGNDWKWFYPQIVDKEYRPNIIVIETGKKYLEKRLLHVEGLQKYAQKIVTENKYDRLKVDIQQLYLLHVNEKYKNCFLTSLRRVLTWGLLLTTISVIILFLTIAIKQTRPTEEIDKVVQTEQIMSSTNMEKLPSGPSTASASPGKSHTIQKEVTANEFNRHTHQKAPVKRKDSP